MLFLQNVVIIFHVIYCQISSMSFVFIFILIINHLPHNIDFLGYFTGINSDNMEQTLTIQIIL